MSTIEQIISTAVSKAPVVRAEPGTYRGKATLSIAFDYKVGEPFKQHVTASVPWQTLFSLALSKLNGVTVETLVEEAVAIMDREETPEQAAIAARAKAAVAKLVAKTEREVSGKITGSCMILEVPALELAGEDGRMVPVETITL
jgi:hypothetical protein